MGHPECNVLNTLFRGPLDQAIQYRNDRFAPFQGKPFLAQVLRVKKSFKLFGGNQFPQQPLLNFHGYRLRCDEFTTNLLTYPILLFFALYVTIFDADFSTIRSLQDVEYLSQRVALSVREAVSDELAIKIPDC